MLQMTENVSYTAKGWEGLRCLFTIDVPVTDESDFLRLVDDVTFRSRLPAWGTPTLVSVLIPLLIFATGAFCAALVGSLHMLLSNHLIYIFVLNLGVALRTILWLERSGPEVVTEIKSAFETPESEYYRFMGSMVARMYYIFPQAKYRSTSRKQLTYVFYICCLLIGVFTFAIVPAVLAPDLFSQAIGMNWSDLHVLLKIYVFSLVSIASIIGVAVTWVVLVGTWHMGVEARGLQVELNITRTSSNLGLRPYAKLILMTVFAYLLIYLITTSVFLIVELNVFVSIGLVIMLTLPLIAFFGSQYGLHIAIQQSKTRRLQKLSEEFDEEIQVWFRNDGPAPSPQTDSSLNEFVAAKESIESLPDWPVTVNSVMKLFSAVFGSNIWIILELVMVLDW